MCWECRQKSGGRARLSMEHKTAPSEIMRCCGPGCRSPQQSSVGAHYDAAYFAWQADIGLKKAKSAAWHKTYMVAANDTVLDFGAGTGAILASLGSRVRGKVAVEFSDVAREYMRTRYPDIQRHKYPEAVPDGSVSLVVSSSVIEHVECPIQELAELRRKLVPGGRVIIGIKNEGVELWKSWRANNRDNHLWTWNSMLLGNTLRAAGFVVDKVVSQATSAEATERMIVRNAFGAKNHTFQYLMGHGHVRRAGEPWPQPPSAIAPLHLPRRTPAKMDRHISTTEYTALREKPRQLRRPPATGRVWPAWLG